jgi:hypothetical protein
MAFVLADYVHETASNPGTGTVNLAGAATGRRAFVDAVGSGNTTYYYITDGTKAEWGIGTVTAGTPNTLARTTVIGNDLGTTAKRNFTGTVQVYIDVPAAKRLFVDGSGVILLPSNSKFSGTLTHEGDAYLYGQMRFYEAIGDTEHARAFFSKANDQLRLFRFDGSNQALSLGLFNGTGYDRVTTQADGYVLRQRTAFTASGTWTKQSWCRVARVIVIGGGGGGGGVDNNTAAAAAGGGGGGGGYSDKFITAGLGATETVTVGAAGAGGAAGNNAGATGGTSSFGAHCSATGGTGGAGGLNNAGINVRQGGTGGTGTGGDVNASGDSGGYGFSDGASGRIASGHGGASMLGGGARGQLNTAAGNAGGNYGGGGSGAAGNNTTTDYAGGDGAPGIVFVEEYA